VLEDNYGGASSNSNAYVLIYFRESNINEILSPVVPEDIPRHLRTYYVLIYLKLVR